MANAATFSALDGKATPVSHTFTLVQRDPTETLWEDRANGFLLGYGVLRLRTERPKTATTPYRVSMTFRNPRVSVPAGNDSSGFTPAPVVDYVNTITVNATLNQRATSADLKDLRVLCINILQNAQIAEAIDLTLHPN